MADQQPAGPRSRRGGVPVGALLLIVIGVVLLFQTTGTLPWSMWVGVWRFWPVILIIIGINVLLGRRAPWLAGGLIAVVLVLAAVGAYALSGGASRPLSMEVTELSEPLQSVTSVDVRVDFGAGDLSIGALPAESTSLVEGRLETSGRKAEVALRRSDDGADLDITMGKGSWLSGFLGADSGADWEVSLSRSPRLSLDLDTGAASMSLDLRDLQVRDLVFDTGASSVEIVMPAHAGRVIAEINGGATSIDILIPDGVAARIRSIAGLASIDIDTHRFPKSGDFFMSPDFDTAENRVDLTITVGAASVDVR